MRDEPRWPPQTPPPLASQTQRNANAPYKRRIVLTDQDHGCCSRGAARWTVPQHATARRVRCRTRPLALEAPAPAQRGERPHRGACALAQMLRLALLAIGAAAWAGTYNSAACANTFSAPVQPPATPGRAVWFAYRPAATRPVALPTRLARARRTWREPQTGRPWLRIESATLR